MIRTHSSRIIRVLISVLVVSLGVLSTAVNGSPQNRTAALQDSILALEQKGDFEQAVEIARELLGAVESDSASRPFQVADAEYRISRLSHIAGLPDSAQQEIAWAEREWSRALQIGPQGELNEAEAVGSSVLPVFRKYMRQEDEDEASCLNHLGDVRFFMGDFRGAEAYFRRALARQEAGRGKETRLYGLILFNLGVTVGDRLSRPTEGVEFLEKAVKVRTALWGPDHYRVAEAKAWLGGFLLSLGEDADAREISREYINAHRNTFGETAQTGSALANRAFAHAGAGDFETAECWFNEGLSLIKADRGPDHWWVGWCLRLFGVLKMLQGDYEAAEEMMAEALRIHRSNYEEMAEQVGWDLYRYAEARYREGDYAGAEELARESLDVRQKHAGAKHAFTADSMTLLGYIMMECERFDEAEVLFADAVSIYDAIGRASTGTLDCYTGLASVMLARGEYADADSLCRKYLAEVIRIREEWHPRSIETLTLLGRIQIAQGDMRGAEDFLERAAQGFEITRARVSTQKLQRTAYAAMASPYPLLAAVKIELGKEAEAWEATERDRGRALLDLLASKQARSLTVEEVAEERRLDAELIRLSGILKVLEADSTASAGAEADSVENQLLLAQAEWAAYQKRLQEKYPVSEGQSYPLGRVQSTLDERAAVIGWLDTELGAYAYVVPKDGEVTWVKLGTDQRAVAPERFVELLDIPGGMTETRDRFARRVCEERVQPLLDELNNVDHLYVVPSGAMADVPVEALITGDGTRVIDRWDVTCVPSASVLAWVKEKPDVQSDVTLFAMGDPPFNETHARAMDQGVGGTEVAMVTRGEE
ncbi:MAG: tetratricopeptide repeat protein, partial [Candidatus Latescibacterota bacterium]